MTAKPLPSELTLVLQAVGRGEAKAAADLLPLVYDELRRLAGRHLLRLPKGQTLQATALVHEAWLRVVGDDDPGWECRTHFFRAAAQSMRRILVDQARRHEVRRRAAEELAAGEPMGAEKEATAGGGAAGRSSTIDVIEVHEALEKLSSHNEKMARIVELRYFGGLSMKDVADVIGEPLRSTERLWTFARSWLEREMKKQGQT